MPVVNDVNELKKKFAAALADGRVDTNEVSGLIADVSEKRYVSPGTSGAVGLHSAMFGAVRRMVPAMSLFAVSAWTVSDDVVTPSTASEKMIS